MSKSAIASLRERFAHKSVRAPEVEAPEVDATPVAVPPSRLKLDYNNTWVALHTTRDTEVSGGGYGRVKMNLEADMPFPTPNANWGTVAYVALYNCPAGGTPVAVQPLTTPKTVLNGDAAPMFAKGGLSIEEVM